MRKNRIALLLCLILGAVLVMSGCQRQRAEISLKKTQQTLAEIRENYNGQQHQPEQLQAIQQRVDEATGMLDSEPGQALEMAKTASTQAGQLLEQVKPTEANNLYSQAMEEIKIANINDLRRIDSERYTRITDLRNEADTAKTDNNWDTVIEKSRQIINEVEAGLAQLRNDAERRRVEAEERLTRLRQTGGTIFAPEIVISVQDDINNATRIASEDRDYQLAINKFSEAIAKAEEGIDKVQGEKARRELEKVEASLTTALIEGALNFKPQEYESTFDLYEELLDQYSQGKYTAVLEGVEVLIPRAQNLVIETKRAASDDRIATMESNLNELEEGGILVYLEGSLDELRQHLQRARQVRQQDTEEAFDQVKQIAVQARDEYERVRERFHQLALDRIRQANNQLETTRAVYDQAREIFDPVDGPMTQAEQAFEAQKQVRAQELGTTLDESQVNLNVADLRRQQGEFRGAIELAREVEQTAETVLGEVYHTVAHNAAIELALLISRYERDGARQYAEAELARSTEMLESVKQTINAGEYKKAVELAAEARADVELMAQRIAGRATENLRDARNAFSSATSEKTRRYRADMLTQVGTLIEQAEQYLQEEKLKLALETAQRATELAQQAEKEANLLAAKDRIDEAQQRISQAQSAGAELYAGREIEDARRLLSSARAVFASEDYVKAEELAVSSTQRARNALYKKIDEAEAAIATARSVNGWDHNPDQLARAYTMVREARQYLEDRQYDQSKALAERAESIAEGLSASAKDENFRTRIARIRENLEQGTKQGINFFQPEESIAIRRQLAELENQYSREDYERVMNEVEKIEARLRVTLGETDELVTTVATQQERRLDQLVEEGALQFASAEVAEARDSLRFASLDYRRGLNKSAHSYLDRAIKLINSIESRLYYEHYADEVEELFAEYSEVQRSFSNVLSLDPEELKQLAIGPGGAARATAISAQITPNQFRERVDELYAKSLAISVPKGMEPIHQSVVTAFGEGRVAALHFEKLTILNRMATAEAMELVDAAYQRMNQSNRLITQVQKHFISDETRFRLVKGDAASLVNINQ